MITFETQQELKQRHEFSIHKNLNSYPSDHRRYRYIEQHGSKILLIENSKALHSSAWLSFNSGSFDDPENALGLAHFLEHMVFMGSEKYPNEGEFDKFINENGGESNGFTSDEDTTFYFNIGHENFKEALVRFVSFFSKPLLKSSCAKREVIAIHNEYMLGHDTDFVRGVYVFQNLVNPKHPAHVFSGGNIDTLKNPEDLVPELRSFFEKHYVTNNMLLVLESQYNLDALESFYQQYFASLRRSKEIFNKSVWPKRFDKDSLSQHIHVESIEDEDIFISYFVIDIPRNIKTEHAVSVICFLCASVEENGLFDTLLKKGYINEYSAKSNFPNVTTAFSDDKQVIFKLSFPLTEKGINGTEEIVRYTFQYFEFLRKEFLDHEFFKKYFMQIQASNELSLEFEAHLFNSPSAYIKHLRHYSLEYFFTGSLITKNSLFPEDEIKQILDGLNCLNIIQVTIQSSHLKQDYEIEIHTKAKFIKKSNHAPKLYKEIDGVTFKAPKISMLMPRDFSLKKQNKNSEVPRLIFSNQRLCCWYLPNNKLENPKITTKFLLLTNYSKDTSLHAVYTHLFLNLITIEINRNFTSQFRLAGSSVNVKSTVRGIELSVHGYSDQHNKIVMCILNLITQFKCDLNDFEKARKTTLKYNLKMSTLPILYQCNSKVHILFNEYSYDSEEWIKNLSIVTLDGLQDFIKKLLYSSKFELYCHGNITGKEVMELGLLIQTSFSNDFKFLAPQGRILSLKAGAISTHKIMHTQANDAVIVVLLCNDISIKAQKLLLILSKIMFGKFFDNLRTKQQLAYKLDCNFCDLEFYRAFIFSIESNNYDAIYLKTKIEEFIELFSNDLESLSKEEFDTIIQSMNLNTNQNLKSLATSYECLFNPGIDYGGYHFGNSLLYNPYSGLTLEDLRCLYHSMVHKDTRRQLSVLGINEERTKKKNKDCTHDITSSINFDIEIKMREEIIRNICQFKQNLNLLPDYMERSENIIACFKEFNRFFIQNFKSYQGDIHSTEIIDVDLEMANTLPQELFDEINHTPLNVDSSKELILTYCFGNYRKALLSSSLMRSGEQEKNSTKLY